MYSCSGGKETSGRLPVASGLWWTVSGWGGSRSGRVTMVTGSGIMYKRPSNNYFTFLILPRNA